MNNLTQIWNQFGRRAGVNSFLGQPQSPSDHIYFIGAIAAALLGRQGFIRDQIITQVSRK